MNADSISHKVIQYNLKSFTNTVLSSTMSVINEGQEPLTKLLFFYLVTPTTLPGIILFKFPLLRTAKKPA